jgi:hypothetical protein
VGPYPESRRDVPIGALGVNGLAEVYRNCTQTESTFVATSVGRSRAPPRPLSCVFENEDKAGGAAEQEGLLALMAELSLRAVRESLRHPNKGDYPHDVHQNPR